MKRFLGPLAALVVALLVAGSVVALASSDGPYAFKVNGQGVSQSDFDNELDVLGDNPILPSSVTGKQQGPFSDSYLPSNLSAAWMQIRIVAMAADQRLRELGEHVTEPDRSAVGYPNTGPYRAVPADFRRFFVEQLATIGALRRVLGSDAALLAEQLRALCPSGRYVSHILVADEATADAIKRQLDAGGDFAQLATANSTDSGSAANGGALGCLAEGQYPADFEAVAQVQPTGVVSAPFKIDAGWDILVVTDQPSKADIDNATLGAALRLVDKADVEVDQRYGTWNQKRGTVAAPKTGGG
jgi:PPIC-type PPIASE domain